MSERHITKITAKRPSEAATEAPKKAKTGDQKATEKAELAKSQQTAPAAKKPAKAKKAAKLGKSQHKNTQKSPAKPISEVFILVRPFVRFGRYLRDSWGELRQVRWPNRKATWKMTLAVLVYCAILMVFILLLDMFFTFIFDLVIGE